ncbi:MAG: AAA family ATPase, partial [Acetobacteraceae bacterium]
PVEGRCTVFAAGRSRVIKAAMREWMRGKLMRRRSKRGPNESESTGKIGQELPTNQPAPLRPAYPEAPVTSKIEVEPQSEAADEAHESRHQPQREPRRDPHRDPHKGATEPEAAAEHATAATAQQVVVETQPESLATPPAEPEAVAARSPRGYVVLTIGLPGSGKTTWYKRRGVQPLSSDMLRTILFDDITDQRYQGLVFSTLRSLLRARLIAKMPWNYVDATNLSPHERRQWIKMAKSFGYEVHAVFFDVPLAVCLERNAKRDRQVSDEAMHKMAERLRPPAFKEGFDKITVVRVKGAQAAGAESAAEAAVEG